MEYPLLQLQQRRLGGREWAWDPIGRRTVTVLSYKGQLKLDPTNYMKFLFAVGSPNFETACFPHVLMTTSPPFRSKRRDDQNLTSTVRGSTPHRVSYCKVSHIHSKNHVAPTLQLFNIVFNLWLSLWSPESSNLSSRKAWGAPGPPIPFTWPCCM